MIDAFEKWIGENTKLSEASRRQYVSQINMFLATYSDISLDNVKKFLFSGDRVYARRFAVKYFCEFMKEPDWIKEIDSLKRNFRLRDRKYVRYLAFDSFKSLMESVSAEMKVALMIMYDTGVRVSPVVNLKLKQIKFDADGHYINVGEKGGKIVKRYLEGYTFEKLETIIVSKQPNDYVFRHRILTTGGKERWETSWECYYRLWKELKTKSKKVLDLGHGISPHWIRTSRAKDLYRQYKDLVKVKSFLNHQQITTTLRYIDEGEFNSAEIIQTEKGKWQQQ